MALRFNDYYTGCRNVSHCQKQSRLELGSLERYRIYSIKRRSVYKFLAFPMRRVFKGGVYFEITFLKSLTINLL